MVVVYHFYSYLAVALPQWLPEWNGQQGGSEEIGAADACKKYRLSDVLQ
jgi:hypothetical protein